MQTLFRTGLLASLLLTMTFAFPAMAAPPATKPAPTKTSPEVKAADFSADALLTAGGATPRILTVPFTGVADEVSRVVWFVPNHTAPVLAVQVQFPQAGFAYDAADRQGTAYLVSQLLLEGAGKNDAIAFQKLLDANAIQLTASVDEDVLTVQMTTLRERADTAFALLRDVLGSPRFDPETVSRLQTKNHSDLKRLSENPSYLAGQLWRQTVYPDHPYNHSKRGTFESVDAIAREELFAWRQAHLTAAHVQISVSGDASEADVQRWLVPVVLAMPAEAAPIPPLRQAAAVHTPKPLMQPFTSPQTQFMFSYPALPRKDPQFPTLLVLNQILGGHSMGSRLTNAIRDKGGLAYSVSTALDTNAASAQLLGSFSTRNAKASQAFALMMAEIRRLASEGATAEEVGAAKSYLIGTLPVQLDGNEAMAGFLSTLQRHALGRDYFATRAARIAAVSTRDVNALARRLLGGTPMVVAVGDPEGRIGFDAAPDKPANPMPPAAPASAAPR